MKKLIALLLVLALAASVAACGNKQENLDALEITKAAEDVAPENNDAVASAVELKFVYEGVELIPGQTFDPAALPQYDSLYTVPSCALEGTDNVYSYGCMEITAFDQGEGEFIYSVYILDDSVATPEGLKIGASVEQVVELYGSDYQDNSGEYIYTQGEVMLSILFDGETVTSIEYLLVV